MEDDTREGGMEDDTRVGGMEDDTRVGEMEDDTRVGEMEDTRQGRDEGYEAGKRWKEIRRRETKRWRV